MAQFYKILKAEPLGDPWTPNRPGAKPIQNWWCQVDGQEKAVSIGKQVGNELRPGMTVYGDLKYAKSQRGVVYWKFDSQKIPEGVTPPSETGGNEAWADKWSQDVGGELPAWFVPYANLITDIAKGVKELRGEVGEPTRIDGIGPVATTDGPLNTEDVKESTTVDKDTKEMLDGIFGPTEEQ